MRPWKNSRMGPSARNGKKVRRTRTSMLPTRISAKRGLSVLTPASVVSLFLLIIDPPSESNSPMGAKRPRNMTMAVEMLKNGVLADAPRKGLPVFAAAGGNCQKILVNPIDTAPTPVEPAAPGMKDGPDAKRYVSGERIRAM